MSQTERKTSTGHTAGIHSATSFGEAERTLKRQRDEEMSQIDASAAGRNAETVYRRKDGKKLDMLTEFMKSQSNVEGKKQQVEQAQYEWGTGSVQKKQFENTKQELLDIANEPFARTVDDPKLERIRKEALRDGDPMAQYFASKQEKIQEEQDEREDREEARQMKNKTDGSSAAKNVPVSRRKPLYKGPTPAPNRFGIRPGYRWDAVDRGTKFEHKVMTKMNEKNSLKDDAYKWSVSDL